MTKEKTVIFEDQYGVSIEEFDTTQQVDSFLEKRLGRRLRVVNIPVDRVIDCGDIDEKIDKALKKRTI